MITVVRNRRKIHVCKLIRPDKIKTYEEPITLYESYSIPKNKIDMETFGLDAFKMIRIRTDIEHAKYYHLGDVVYVDAELPEEHDPYCKTADYEVYLHPTKTLNYVEVILKQRSGR